MASRWTKLLLWTVTACLIAGTYGALHNQISYSISAEFFDRILFPRLRIPDAWCNRWGASAVGWMSAWWTGLFFGPPMVLITQRRCRPENLSGVLIVAFLVAVVSNMVCELGAVSLATMVITRPMTAHWGIPIGVEDPVAFARAGIMHDASYAGGVLATIAGCVFIILMTRRSSPTTNSTEQRGLADPIG